MSQGSTTTRTLSPPKPKLLKKRRSIKTKEALPSSSDEEEVPENPIKTTVHHNSIMIPEQPKLEKRRRFCKPRPSQSSDEDKQAPKNTAIVNSSIVISDSPEGQRKESTYDYDVFVDHDYRGKIFIRKTAS